MTLWKISSVHPYVALTTLYLLSTYPNVIYTHIYVYVKGEYTYINVKLSKKVVYVHSARDNFPHKVSRTSHAIYFEDN